MANSLENRVNTMAVQSLTAGMRKLAGRVSVEIKGAAGYGHVAAQRYMPVAQNALNNSLPYLPALGSCSCKAVLYNTL